MPRYRIRATTNGITRHLTADEVRVEEIFDEPWAVVRYLGDELNRRYLYRDLTTQGLQVGDIVEAGYKNDRAIVVSAGDGASSLRPTSPSISTVLLRAS